MGIKIHSQFNAEPLGVVQFEEGGLPRHFPNIYDPDYELVTLEA
jgi:hypothetical protein